VCLCLRGLPYVGDSRSWYAELSSAQTRRSRFLYCIQLCDSFARQLQLLALVNMSDHSRVAHTLESCSDWDIVGGIFFLLHEVVGQWTLWFVSLRCQNMDTRHALAHWCLLGCGSKWLQSFGWHDPGRDGSAEALPTERPHERSFPELYVPGRPIIHPQSIECNHQRVSRSVQGARLKAYRTNPKI